MLAFNKEPTSVIGFISVYFLDYMVFLLYFFFHMKENIIVLHINQRYLELIAFRGICETLKKEIDM